MKSSFLGPAFRLLWLSELAFNLGGALMGFALGVWVFERTNSAQQLSFTLLSAAIPALLVLPVAGALADRFDRRWLIVGSDLVQVIVVAVLATLVMRSSLSVEHLYFINAVSAMIGAVRGPAYQAVYSSIVPVDSLTRANGLISLSRGLLQAGAPMLAGALMSTAGLASVVMVELILLIAGALTVFAALSHARHAIRSGSVITGSSVLTGLMMNIKTALVYFTEQPLMTILLAYVIVRESLMVLVSTMMTPLVLSTHTSATLGLILTSAAAGGLTSSLLLIGANIKRHLMVWILVSDAALSFFVLLAGWVAATWMWCLCAFLAAFAASVSGAASGALWMRKTPKQSRGSLFALIGMCSLVSMCVVILCAGGIGEHVFEPALLEGGAWASSIGSWVGTGKGRGFGFLFMVVGTACVCLSLVALLNPRLRRLDQFVEDRPDSVASVPSRA